MQAVDATQTLPIPEWDDPQAQLLEDTWLLTLFVVLLASAFPWFVSSLNIDFATASWAVLALGIVYVTLSLLVGRSNSSGGWHRRVVPLLHAAGVIVLGFLWQSCGGLQNPAFLLAFVLPVIGASALSRGQPYVTAGLALLVVCAVALSEAPELRWYLADVHAGGRWLAPLLGPGALGAGPGATALGAFPGFYAPVSYDTVLLEVFAILVLACAVASESLGYAFQRLIDRLTAARGEAAQAQQLWAMLLQELPAAAALVDCETLQIVLASERLAPLCGVSPPLTDRPVLELLHVSYPERIQELIGTSGGSATVVLEADRLRMVELRVQHLLCEGRRLALLLVEDISEAFCSRAALDADEHAALIIDAGARLLVANKPARALFPAAAPGADATTLLGPLANAPAARRTSTAVASGAAGVARWWESGLGGRRRLLLTIAHRRYQVLCTAVALPGEEQTLYVVALAPAWPGASGATVGTDISESLAGGLR